MQRKLVLCLVFAASLIAQPQEETARTALNRGVAAFKAARYADAVAAFELATKLEPGNANAYVYLGTTFMSQWIPGANSPENIDLLTRAETAFRAALQIDPREKTAMVSLASIAFMQGKAIQAGNPGRNTHFDEAEVLYRKVTEIDSNDKSALYSLGVIAWERFYPDLLNARTRLRMRPEDPGPLPDFNARAELRSRYARTVEEGMEYLNRAIAIDPMYDDAMAYLNLLYRERADWAETPADYKRDLATADELVGKALAARKSKAESQSSSPYAPAPPPPPPPPPPAPQGGGPVERIRVGGNVQAANLIHKPTPVYPPLAQQARVQGTVRFSVIIGKDGRVQNIQLISGHPLMVPAATEAVREYLYRPTLLNGQPVEVITQVDVNFTLPN